MIRLVPVVIGLLTAFGQSVGAQEFYWQTHGNILRWRAGDQEVETVVDCGCVRSFVFDRAAHRIFYEDSNSRLIRLDLRTNTVEFQFSPIYTVHSELLAYDSLSETVYFGNTFDGIWRIVGSQKELIHSLETSHTLYDLEINEPERRLYWIDLEDRSSTLSYRITLQRSDLDGLNKEILFQHDWDHPILMWRAPTMFKLDPHAGRAFWLSLTWNLELVNPPRQSVEYIDVNDPVRKQLIQTLTPLVGLAFEPISQELYLLKAPWLSDPSLDKIPFGHCVIGPFCDAILVLDLTQAYPENLYVDPCMLGDFPRSRDIADFVECNAGPAELTDRSCYCSDFYFDLAVDLHDFAAFQRLYLGD